VNRDAEEFLDIELELSSTTSSDYLIGVSQSPAGKAREAIRLSGDETKRDTILSGLHKLTATDVDKMGPQLGRILFDTFITRTIRRVYDTTRHEAKTSGRDLRMKLRIYRPELMSMPWELLYDARHNEYLGLGGRITIVRYQRHLPSKPPLVIAPPVRILGVIADPDDLSALDSDREREQLENAISPLRANKLIELEWLGGRTWNDLQAELRAGRWNILHFIGYGREAEMLWPSTAEGTGSYAGYVAFADQFGRAHWVREAHLGGLFAQQYALRLIVLGLRRPLQKSAPGSDTVDRGVDLFSRTAEGLLNFGLPAVLGLPYDLLDRSVLSFLQRLYRNVTVGDAVDLAVTEARHAVNESFPATLDWGVPVLHMSSPDGVIFEIKAARSYVDAQGAMSRRDWKAAVEKLEEALKLAPGLTDAVRLLREARQQLVLAEPEPLQSGSLRKSTLIFISYAREDRDDALGIYDFLTTNGFSPWIDERDLLGGQEWELEIDKVIHEAEIFIACVSSRSTLKRGFVQAELAKALEVRKTIPEGQIFVIPIRLDPCAVPRQLSQLHWIDYFSADGPTRLRQALTQHLRKEEAKAEAAATRLVFANIGIEATNGYWVEANRPPGYPFHDEAIQYFTLTEFVSGAEPSFDVTLLNMASTPMILTKIGIEILSVASISYAHGYPKPVKIKRTDAYAVEMPHLCRRSPESAEEFFLARPQPIEVNQFALTRITDPIYLEALAPFRYSLTLTKYSKRMPNNVLMRLCVTTNHGQECSHIIALCHH
jgi:hypothetical protein